MQRSFYLLTFLLFAHTICFGQNKKQTDKCGTNQLLQQAFIRKPATKKAFDAAQKLLARPFSQATREQAVINIPVVFHVVLPNPSVLTDAAILQQLAVLNDDYAGLNADSVNILPAFKPLFGKSAIRFCMAQQTPDGEPTNGIERIASSTTSILGAGDPVKYTSKGGSDSWDPKRYLNIWLTSIPGGILGYSSIPGIDLFPANEDGVVILYTTLPGGSTPHYNSGRTAVHEIGHYFSLMHIWGDDNGTCTGTDFPGTPALDDTPNQADATFGCLNGMVTDICSPVAPGILYQDYMDYTDDACMALFTHGQVTRMENAVAVFRPELTTSNGCTAPVIYSRNIKVQKINFPIDNICTASFQPVVTIRNIGSSTITSLTITALVDGVVKSTSSWTGNLASFTNTEVTLNAVNGLTTGSHQLTIYTSNPNGAADENTSNDTTKSTIVFPPILSSPLKEGFEGTTFPPSGWAVSNPDGDITWARTTLAAKTGVASAYINNYDYAVNNEVDRLITPLFAVNGTDSSFLTFQLAAATYTDPGTPGNPFDTLQILITTDCGASYTSVYKKWGADLITRADKVNGLTTSFVPTSTEWRKDSVFLTPYLNGANTIQVVFKNTSNFENNVYIDDVNLYNIVINPFLKEKGILITPNPFTSSFVVQHYPNPATLKAIGVYNSVGQLISQRNFAVGTAPNYIGFDLPALQSGMYYVKIFYTDKTVTQKILKLK